MKKRTQKMNLKTRLINHEKGDQPSTVSSTEMKNPRPAWVLSFKSGVGRTKKIEPNFTYLYLYISKILYCQCFRKIYVKVNLVKFNEVKQKCPPIFTPK